MTTTKHGFSLKFGFRKNMLTTENSFSLKSGFTKILFTPNIPLLGLDSGYKVKYTLLSSGVPSGFALGNYFRQRGIFDCMSLLSS